MKLKVLTILCLSLAFVQCSDTSTSHENQEVQTETETENTMSEKDSTNATSSLGAFSISLSVKDLKTSKEFYEKLGFDSMGGDESMGYLIMKNGSTIIGIFQGMFEGNILTFNPGWDANAKNLEEFSDIREIQKDLLVKGIEIENQIADSTSGPASLTITDPDGNIILLDQHR